LVAFTKNAVAVTRDTVPSDVEGKDLAWVAQCPGARHGPSVYQQAGGLGLPHAAPAHHPNYHGQGNMPSPSLESLASVLNEGMFPWAWLNHVPASRGGRRALDPSRVAEGGEVHHLARDEEALFICTVTYKLLLLGMNVIK